MKTKGFSLLEVMISLAIFATSLLGLMKLQTLSLRYAYAALLRAQAQAQMVNLADMLMVSLNIDTGYWQQSNANYLPASKSMVGDNQVRLVWQVYDQPEALSLQVFK
ncbi:MAG: prepilin-type N-terminal cleavage/methylation domain-containing protein [Gammaproteobacteria bacterium]